MSEHSRGEIQTCPHCQTATVDLTYHTCSVGTVINTGEGAGEPSRGAEEGVGESPAFEPNVVQGWDTSLDAGGGVKYDQGKLRWDLLPVEAMEETVWNYTMGSSKYQDDNWRKGMSFRRCFGAMCRHAFKWFMGEQRDPQDGQHHLAAVAFYALNLMQLELEQPGFDDRYNPNDHAATGFMKENWYIMERPEL